MGHFLVSDNSFLLCDYRLKRFRILIFYVAVLFISLMRQILKWHMIIMKDWNLWVMLCWNR